MSRPSVSKVADFLLFLSHSLSLSFSSIASYCPMLSGVIHFVLLELSSHFVLRDLLLFSFRTSFAAFSCPSLGSSHCPSFSAWLSLRDLTRKVLFLVALATSRRVGELQTVSSSVSSSGADLFLSYLLEFCTKTESSSNSLQCLFCVSSLKDFVGLLPEEPLLCPVHVLSAYISRTSFSPRSRSLFVSHRSPSRALSKNALSFFVRDLIPQASSSSSPSVSLPCPSSSSSSGSAFFLFSCS